MEDVIFSSLLYPPAPSPPPPPLPSPPPSASHPSQEPSPGQGRGLWEGGAALTLGYPTLKEEQWEGECSGPLPHLPTQPACSLLPLGGCPFPLLRCQERGDHLCPPQGPPRAWGPPALEPGGGGGADRSGNHLLLPTSLHTTSPEPQTSRILQRNCRIHALTTISQALLHFFFLFFLS